MEMAIGMVFIFLLLSLVVSAIREAIEARLQDRAKLLGRGLKEVLGGDYPSKTGKGVQGDELIAKFYRHPLIESLYSGPFDENLLKYKRNTLGLWIPKYLMSFVTGRTKMPAYIPARSAALALLDLARTHRLGQGNGTDPTVVAIGELKLGEVRLALQEQKDSRVARALLAALAESGEDVEKGVKAVQDWYDGSMDRVSGWFKRETQQMLFVLGLVVAVGLNVDAIFMVKFLASDEAVRTRLVATAVDSGKSPELKASVERLRVAETPSAPASASPEAQGKPGTPAEQAKPSDPDANVTKAIDRFVKLSLPIGWTHTRWEEFRAREWQVIAWSVVGWFLTAFALSFGAPFWFDVMNKLMVIRSTVKPHEKSPEESSEDRQRTKKV
ncbi:hypothetical protein WKW79_17245 [Variovorax robiniae]|uniref:Type II secretion system protein GspF domain-containing protein n=1 Tax=Variovorax robiniae TaxID=1836199 RepID=A0ABU8X956_9BURK